MTVKVAIVQAPPVLLHRDATMERALAHLEAAAGEGARLVVFPEAWFPGYPTWVWRLRPGGDMALTGEIHARLRENAVDLARGDLAPLCRAAAERGLTIVCGINEVDGTYSGSTLYNSVVVIGPDGAVLNRHRKLIPTNPERMVWGQGDATGLKVVDTPVGRIGCLICWENYMPLARYALYAQSLDILVAPTWDCGDGWQASMRHIAREGGCWVLSTATAIQGSDLPADFPQREALYPDAEEWICDGDAVIVRPFGGPVAGPLHRDKAILYGEIDPAAAARARRSLDVAGHYARPDIFRLEVNDRAMPPVRFTAMAAE
ncbi:MAG TPA: carbon-nitrogen hydrolase family protein [Afifellaceae bacterium]|nr:carbon-nitrogen hydrolase family protein [Afifellaceae bacterium]